MRQGRKKIGFLLIPALFFIPFMFFLVFGFKNPPAVEATGGAFKDTKHGGGTVDGIPFSGVDRALNPDFALFYNDAAGAGKYEPGECTHCHEPHASFGQIEPKPRAGGDSGPDRYLLMKEYGTSTNYANLCWYCHENINFNPILNGGTGFWNFYQGKAVYEDSSHHDSSAFYWPGDGSVSPIWPRRGRSGLPSGNEGSCLNCHTPHGIKASDSGSAYDTTSPDGSGGVPAAMQTVASGNPSVNEDYLIPRQLIAWEETLCERCHDSTGPWVNNANIQDEINKRYGGSGHPVDDTSLAGRHVVSEDLPMGISAPDPDVVKHVECYDCHNPHAVKAPTGILGDGDGGRIKGMRYVDIDGMVMDPAMGDRQPYIYEICFKCHGDTYNIVFINDYPFPDTQQPDPPSQGPFDHPNRAGDDYHFSNKRKEFDPSSHFPLGFGPELTYNTSYHPVATPGLNGTPALCYQLRDAFGQPSLDCSDPDTAADFLSNLTIQCTDCHNTEDTGAASTAWPITPVGPVTQSNLRDTDYYDASKIPATPVGPHGSERNRLLRGNYTTTNSGSGNLDGSGSALNTYRNSYRIASNGRPRFELCFLCHREDYLLYIGGGGFYPTNFGSNTDETQGGEYWEGNLHVLHLGTSAVCHDCHHNVHSNVEAQNTIYGDGFGGQLPPDNHDGLADGKINTHLVNFGPTEGGSGAAKPRWFFDGTYFRCYIVCHGLNMSLCGYTHGTAIGAFWCAE